MVWFLVQLQMITAVQVDMEEGVARKPLQEYLHDQLQPDILSQLFYFTDTYPSVRRVLVMWHDRSRAPACLSKTPHLTNGSMLAALSLTQSDNERFLESMIWRHTSLE